MEKGDLFNKMIRNGFHVDDNEVYKIDNLYSNTFDFPTKPEPKHTEFTFQTSSKILVFQLLMEPLPAPTQSKQL